MRKVRSCSFALGLALALCVAQPSVLAQASSDTAGATPATDVEKRIADLEKQLDALRGELSSLKSAAAPAPANAVVATSTPVSTPAPNPLAGISSVLGGATLTGLVDSYYQVNTNHPSDRTSQLRSFDGPNSQFTLNLIELTLDKGVDKDSPLGYRLAVGYGNAMNTVNASDPGGIGFAQYLKEAYVSYLAPVGKGLQIDAGKFVTPHGAEVIESNQNWNYSRGLLFSYAIPYYHFGLRAKYAFNSKYALSGYVVNGWNSVVDNNVGKTYGVGFGWTPTKKLSITQNYMAGPETAGVTANWRQLSDTVISYAATSKLSLMANVDYGRGDRVEGIANPVDWSGVAGYARYAFTPQLALAARYEYYNDHDGFTTGTKQHINGFTGTLERRIASHLISRFEVRHDQSSADVFQTTDKLAKSQTTVTGGLVFVLEPSESK
jgi:hypothetical protein